VEHTVLSQEYLVLARRFSECALLAETLECASMALRLDGGKAPEVAALVAETVETGSASPREAPRDPGPLRRHKHKLDQAYAAEVGLRDGSLAVLSEDVKLPSLASPGKAPGPEIERAFGRILRILRQGDVTPPSRMLSRVRRAARAAGVDLDRASECNEDDDDYWFGELSLEHELHNLANDLYKLERFAESIELYTLALEVRPDLLEAYFNRGLAHTRVCSYISAAEDINRVIELNPHLAEAYYTLGLIRQYQGDYDAAIAQYTRALEVDPKYERARTQRDETRARAQEPYRPPSSGRSDDDSGLVRDFSAFEIKPDCNFSMVGGCAEAKQELRMIAEQLKGSSLFEKWGIAPPRGVILHGPPGTGKSLLAEALAGEVACPFYSPPVGIYHSMWAGNTEANLRRLFTEASAHPAAVIFLDELDSIASRRGDARTSGGEHWYNRIVGALLDLISSAKSGLIVIGATNSLHNVDPAFLRPGRFDYLIPVDVPTEDELVEIWAVHLRQAEERATRVPLLAAELHEALLGSLDRRECSEARGRPAHNPLREMAQASAQKGFTGADVREVIRRIAKSMMRLEHAVGGIDVGPISTDEIHREIARYQVAEYRRELWGPDRAQAE
jgi:transitional endoplasmic reticulum ATPase